MPKAIRPNFTYPNNSHVTLWEYLYQAGSDTYRIMPDGEPMYLRIVMLDFSEFTGGYEEYAMKSLLWEAKMDRIPTERALTLSLIHLRMKGLKVPPPFFLPIR